LGGGVRSPYRFVGMVYSAPVRIPLGQRDEMVFIFVKNRTDSGPCIWVSPNLESLAPPKL